MLSPRCLRVRSPKRYVRCSGTGDDVDTLSKERRSWNMSRIKSRDTAPEKIVRSLLHRLGFRFRLHRSDLPGKPDITLPKYRTVIFVHGCFWHRHSGCRYAYSPKSNAKFWAEKLSGNAERDQTNTKKLRKLGWCVRVVWECETRDEKRLDRRLRAEIAGKTQTNARHC